MKRSGRPRALSRDREQAFRLLWENPYTTVAEIARLSGMDPSTAYATARRLRLPSRAEIRERAGLPPQGPLNDRFNVAAGAAARQQHDEERAAEQVARCERLLAQETPRPASRWIRCDVCGGRAQASAPHRHEVAA